MLQKMIIKEVKDTHAAGADTMDMILGDCLDAADKMGGHGGFVPSQ